MRPEHHLPQAPPPPAGSQDLGSDPGSRDPGSPRSRAWDPDAPVRGRREADGDVVVGQHRFELFRDSHGVPHVRAATERALAYGQGYATALDRADQLETGRRRAEGRLAARIGPDGLVWDRFAVRVRLADTARRVHDALGAPEQEWLAAYADGVNAGLGAARAGSWSPEGGRPGLAPGPDGPDAPAWRPWTPIGVFLVDHVLFNGFPAVLWRDHVARTLGPVFPHVPPETLCEWFAADGGPGAGSDSGSNAWAVAPGGTASGRPLLAGDPHRILELPGPYQQIRLACTGEGPGEDAYDVLGLAFPGVPGVQHFGFAATGRAADGAETGVAWGITNAMAHHVEVFEERLRRSDDGGWEALGPGGWEPVDTGTETVEVRGPANADLADPETGATPRLETVRWIETPRGVWIADRDAAAQDELADENLPRFTIRWPVRVLADAGVATWRRLLRSRTARDVADAFADGWVDPVNRVLTADSGGDVYSLTAGRVARRAPEERVLPVRAWTEAARTRDWTRLPEPELVTNGVAVDANERPVSSQPATDGAARPRDRRRREAHALGWSYAPHRAGRIRELLAEPPAGGESPLTQRRIHADVASAGALALMELTGVPKGLDAWADAGAPLDADSVEAARFVRWRDALVRDVAADPRLAPLHTDPRPYGEIFAPWFVVEAAIGHGLPSVLRGLEPGADLDLGSDPEAQAPRESIAVRGGTADRVHDAAETWGTVETWGDLHVLTPVRLPDGPHLPLPAVAVAGDNDTVRCTGGTPGVTPGAARGSVARWIWDLSDRRASRWVVPFGASGNPGDPHVADQHETWADGDTIPVETDWTRLTRVELPQAPQPASTGPSPTESLPEPDTPMLPSFDVLRRTATPTAATTAAPASTTYPVPARPPAASSSVPSIAPSPQPAHPEPSLHPAAP